MKRTNAARCDQIKVWITAHYIKVQTYIGTLQSAVFGNVGDFFEFHIEPQVGPVNAVVIYRLFVAHSPDWQRDIDVEDLLENARDQTFVDLHHIVGIDKKYSAHEASLRAASRGPSVDDP